jgi:uncharacterized protein (DUF433 family)
MAYPASAYVEERDGGLYISGARVSLDSVVIHFQEGASSARIADSFPTLQLWQVYGAINYYLEHEEAVRDYLALQRQRDLANQPLSQTNPELFARLQEARRQKHAKHL